MRVEQVMTKQVQCCRPEDTLEQAARSMWDNDCGCLPVCSGDGVSKIAGMITDRDIAMCALFQGRPLHELAVADAMARDVQTCHPGDILADAEKLMREGRIRRLPVVDDDQSLVGMISLVDLAQEAARERSARVKEITDVEVNDTFAEICAPRARQQLAA
jgi:CBS domain-containing protein